ncbi:MAG: methionine--tRNA ligase subunit beta [Candidatus Micrarchaeia archaeon]
MATIEEFNKIDIRIGKILEAELHEKAKKPMYKIKVDLGKELGIRQIIAGIAKYYEKEELIGKRVAIVSNLEPKEIAGEISNGMLLATEDENGTVSLLVPDKNVSEGSTVH